MKNVLMEVALISSILNLRYYDELVKNGNGGFNSHELISKAAMFIIAETGVIEDFESYSKLKGLDMDYEDFINLKGFDFLRDFL